MSAPREESSPSTSGGMPAISADRPGGGAVQRTPNPARQVGLVDRARSLAVGVEPAPVAGRPPSVDPVHEVRHHDVAVQVRVPVAADGVRELAGHHAAGRDHDVAADSRDRRAAPDRPAPRPPRPRARRRSGAPSSGPPSANSTLADFGALNVRSYAATVTREDPMGRPVAGCRPAKRRWTPAASAGPSNLNPAAAAPVQRAGTGAGSSRPRSER